MLPEDATDAGLLGVSFLGGRGLSMPFSGGEWAGLARGVAGSWRNPAEDCSYVTDSYSAHVNKPFEASHCDAHLIRHIYHQIITFLSVTVLEDNWQICYSGTSLDRKSVV